MRKIVHLSGLFSVVVLFASLAVASQSGLNIKDEVTGELAYAHVHYLSEEIGARLAGTAQEEEAADYIAGEFERIGYQVEVQPFSVFGDTLYSQNIVATKPGKFAQTVIIGAHYDSVSERSCTDGNTLTGAGDNGSGVGVMLEVAEVLAEYKTRANIVFIAFGAEEVGLWGSEYYVNQMTDQEIADTVAMINLDSVGAGDHFYVYSGIDDNPGWARDLALNIGHGMGYDLRTSPESECFAWGTTGDWSDHVLFRAVGIPIAYFEWMNWDIEPCGGIESEELGWIMHSCLDNLDYTSPEKLEKTADVVAALVFEMAKNKLPMAEKGKIAQGNRYISIMKRTDLAK